MFQCFFYFALTLNKILSRLSAMGNNKIGDRRVGRGAVHLQLVPSVVILTKFLLSIANKPPGDKKGVSGMYWFSVETVLFFHKIY